jgi:hypothetical protein
LKLVFSDVFAQSNKNLVKSNMYACALSRTIDKLLRLEQTGTKAKGELWHWLFIDKSPNLEGSLVGAFTALRDY